jgi:hypothetical protein
MSGAGWYAHYHKGTEKYGVMQGHPLEKREFSFPNGQQVVNCYEEIDGREVLVGQRFHGGLTDGELVELHQAVKAELKCRGIKIKKPKKGAS